MPGMAWNALILSSDEAVLGLLQPAMAELEMAGEMAPGASLALLRLEEDKYDAAICDCDAALDPDLLRSVRQASANPKLVVIAVVGEASAMQTAFNQGANFVLCKPLNSEIVWRTIRAATCVLHRLARRFPRRMVHKLSMVTIDGARDAAILMQLGEGGVGIQALEPLEVSRSLQLQFEIPGTLFSVATRGEIAWADPSGRVGIRFMELAADARARIREWVFSDSLDSGVEADLPPTSGGGRIRLTPGPQRLCAALVDGGIVVAATAMFEIVALGMVRNWPHRMMAQATAMAVPALFWSVYQFLFLHAHTPGTRLARRMGVWLAASGPAWRRAALAPLRKSWGWTARLGARIELDYRRAAGEPETSITIQPAARA